jgi:hypothetical protein
VLVDYQYRNFVHRSRLVTQEYETGRGN